jgi:4-hydroxybenzoate polyprenyltransferase
MKPVTEEQSNARAERYKLDCIERNYNLIGMLCFGAPISFGGMLVAEKLGLDMKLWWSFFAIMFVTIGFGWAAFFAERGYKKLLQADATSLDVKRAQFVACRSRRVASIMAGAPLIPLVLMVLGVKVSSYLAIPIIALWSFGKSFANAKAIKETGYDPS